MKTAVSIPDDLYDRADRLARKLEMTRSGLFSAALKQFVARHTDDDVTEAMNAALLEIGDQADPFIREASISRQKLTAILAIIDVILGRQFS